MLTQKQDIQKGEAIETILQLLYVLLTGACQRMSEENPLGFKIPAKEVGAQIFIHLDDFLKAKCGQMLKSKGPKQIR